MKFLFNGEELFKSNTVPETGDVIIFDERYYTVIFIAIDYNSVNPYDSSRTGHKVAILQLLD